MAQRAGILTRISLDRDGTKESPQTQEDACRRWCDQHGAEVVRVYSDRDRSGWKRGVKREGYEALLADLAAGLLDVIVVFKVDRLTRQGITAVGRVLEALDRAGAILVSATEGFDSTTSMGEMILSNLACIAKAESENTSLRVKAGHSTAASKGRPNGGSRCFGYQRDHTINQEEAAVVRELHKRVLAGESLRQLAFDLNRREIRTTQGKEWSSATVGQMLQSAKLRGWRSHNGELHKGNWEPILSESEHLALVELLNDPRRRSTRRSGLRHLLTGTAVCGLCGGDMKYMVMVNRSGSRFPRYQCVKNPGFPNCGKTAVTMASLDRYVKSRLLAQIADGAHQEPDPLSDEQKAKLEALLDEDRLELEDLSQRRFFHRSITDGEYASTRALLVERIATTEARLADLNKADEHMELPRTYEELEAWWESAEVTERRSVLKQYVRSVEIHPALRRGGNVFDQNRAKIFWR